MFKHIVFVFSADAKIKFSAVLQFHFDIKTIGDWAVSRKTYILKYPHRQIWHKEPNGEPNKNTLLPNINGHMTDEEKQLLIL